MIDAHRRNLGDTERLGGQGSAVTADGLAVTIDQDRDIETENSDALGDLPDLFAAVAARVGRIWLERINPAVLDRHSRENACVDRRSGAGFHL